MFWQNFWSIELLYFVAMLAVFIVLLLVAKLPSGICLMISSVVGAILSAIISKTDFAATYFVEGVFGYFDTILIITTAMIFMGAMEVSGALEYLSALLVKAFGKTPSLLLIAFMIIIMFPAMVTGSAIAAAISSGALVAPIMRKWGVPKDKVGAFVATGAILGEVAPPINVPAMVICDTVDIAFSEFTLPLLLLSIPLAIVLAIVLGRKYVKPLSEEDQKKVCNMDILKELKWTVTIPFIVLVLLIVGEIVSPTIFGSLGMSAMFVISSIIAFFLGRRLPLYKKRTEGEDQSKPNSIVEVVSRGVERSFAAAGLLMGVGMFMEILTLTGIRGYLISVVYTFPDLLQKIGAVVAFPLVGGISSFGSASMFGGPFIMALKSSYYEKILVCGFSLLAAAGEFLPPAAVSASFSAEIVGEKKWTKVTKAAWPSLVGIIGYGIVYVFAFGSIFFKLSSEEFNGEYLLLLAITIAVAVALVFLYELLLKKTSLKKFQKSVDEVVLEEE